MVVAANDVDSAVAEFIVVVAAVVDCLVLKVVLVIEVVGGFESFSKIFSFRLAVSSRHLEQKSYKKSSSSLTSRLFRV